MKREPAPRAEAIAMFAPFLALLLLLPPVITLVANAPRDFHGAPPVMIYLFGLWLLIVIIGALVSRILRNSAGNGEDGPHRNQGGR